MELTFAPSGSTPYHLDYRLRYDQIFKFMFKISIVGTCGVSSLPSAITTPTLLT